MKYILIIGLLLSIVSCDTKYNYDDTGLAKGHFDGNMYEYFCSHPSNWDSLRMMIDKAGLQDLFEGKRAGYEKITFFGPVNYTLIRWMIANEYTSIDELDPAVCEEIVMRHVVKGVYMRDDIPRGKQSDAGTGIGVGGITFNGESEHPIWIYSYQMSHQGVPGVGAVLLFIASPMTGNNVDVASTNIESDNGVVHSLSNSYSIGEF
ncbi:MAG: fasciclin domain-containing protein [Odoribacter sp.]